jgi:hypothetical protein
LGKFGNQLAGEAELVGTGQLALAVLVDEQQRVVVAAEGGRAKVGDDQRDGLAAALGVGMFFSLSAAKPTQ